MALTTTGYLDRKEIPLSALKKACRSRVFCKEAELPLMNDDSEIVDYYKGPMIFRELVDPLNRKAGFERILDEKVKLYASRKAGDKYLTSGSSTSGFTPIGFDPKDLGSMEGILIVNAGVADGYRLYENTGHPVACGVGENSIPKIAAALRTVIGAYGGRVKVVTTGDNDPAGLRACIKSSQDWVVPSSDKDWSDVYQNQGGEAVKSQFNEGLQSFVPIDQVDARLEEMGLTLSGSAQAKPKAGKNRFMLKLDESACIGYQLGIRIRDNEEIESLKQYVQLAARIGCYRDAEGDPAFVSKDANGHALLMTLLHDGLYDTLDDKDRQQADAFSRLVLEAASKGHMETIEPIDASPVVATLKRSDHDGLLLQVSSAYDERVIKAMNGVDGRWNKEDKLWEVALKSSQDFSATISSVEQALPGRLALAPRDRKAFFACFPGREDVLASVIREDLSWLDNVASIKPAGSQPPASKSSSALTVGLERHNDWDVLAISLPEDRRHLKEQLKTLDAVYRDKIWYLPISQNVVDYVAGLSPQWENCTEQQVRDIQARKGFGVVAMLGGDRFIIKTPFAASLVERLKGDLPRMARQYDKELGAWEIHVASGAIGAVLQGIIQDFDLRVMSRDAKLMGKDEGLEFITPRQSQPVVDSEGISPHDPSSVCQHPGQAPQDHKGHQSLAASRQSSPASG